MRGLCFISSDPLIEGLLKNLSIKGSGAQKQRPYELWWMLWFDEKIYLIHSHDEQYLKDGKTGFNFFTSDFISTYYKLASQSQTSSESIL